MDGLTELTRPSLKHRLPIVVKLWPANLRGMLHASRVLLEHRRVSPSDPVVTKYGMYLTGYVPGKC